jgi:hypothetical protein
MISFKNNLNNQQTTQNYDMNTNHFGNDWGLFVDIEKEKINLPNNHEVLREKYSIQFYNYDVTCDDIEDLKEIYIDFDDFKTNPNHCIPLLIKASTTTTILLILTYIILVIL